MVRIRPQRQAAFEQLAFEMPEDYNLISGAAPSLIRIESISPSAANGYIESNGSKSSFGAAGSFRYSKKKLKSAYVDFFYFEGMEIMDLRVDLTPYIVAPKKAKRQGKKQKRENSSIPGYSDYIISRFDGADSITGTYYADTLRGWGGDDYLADAEFADNEDDIIYGGLGNDTIVFSGGSNHIYGGAGKDTFRFFNSWGGSISLTTIYDYEAGIDTIEWTRADVMVTEARGGNLYIMRQNEYGENEQPWAVLIGASGL